MNIKIYTDGACSSNPGPGGWGCVLQAVLNIQSKRRWEVNEWSKTGY